ncbi:Endonuclease/exonuclease/phosphatase [Trinorchestia longiramus]|nr:Endonuclease/exonuclease/phosphatase [Trinorchestia longiramus]
MNVQLFLTSIVQAGQNQRLSSYSKHQNQSSITLWLDSKNGEPLKIVLEVVAFELLAPKRMSKLSEQRSGETRRALVLMGDMNGHVGIHENGLELIDFCEGNELENLNLAIENGLHTWKSKEFKAAIDYVLVNYEARRYVRKMYVDENDFDVEADH